MQILADEFQWICRMADEFANSEVIPACNFRNAVVFTTLFRDFEQLYGLFCKNAHLIKKMTEERRHIFRSCFPSLIWQGYFRPGKEMEKNNEMIRRLEWIPCVEKLNGLELGKETTEPSTQ